MKDPELQEAVESLLWSLGERTRCAVCFKIKSQGHTQSCRIGKLHAILNSRVDPGVSHPNCRYLAPTGGPCNKCGWSPSTQETTAPLSMEETQRALGAVSHEPMSHAAALDRFSRRHDVNITDEQIKHMVDRFLAWRLPENFQPDAGISFKPEYNVEYNDARGLPPARHQPSGTNLFDATQAEAMVRYMVEGMPSGLNGKAQP